MELDKNQIGLAGEYYVLAQLTAQGLIATLTLGHTKGIDIIVTNQDINQLFKVEVKTTINPPRREKLFHKNNQSYHWPMSEKHETLKDNKLIYCFVYIENVTELPKFFLVPSKEVARYVKWEHNHWLKSRKNEVQSTTMRNFRIEVNDPKGYCNNWEIFKLHD
jgi:hypothetical protein